MRVSKLSAEGIIHMKAGMQAVSEVKDNPTSPETANRRPYPPVMENHRLKELNGGL